MRSGSKVSGKELLQSPERHGPARPDGGRAGRRVTKLLCNDGKQNPDITCTSPHDVAPHWFTSPPAAADNQRVEFRGLPVRDEFPGLSRGRPSRGAVPNHSTQPYGSKQTAPSCRSPAITQPQANSSPNPPLQSATHTARPGRGAPDVQRKSYRAALPHRPLHPPRRRPPPGPPYPRVPAMGRKQTSAGHPGLVSTQPIAR